MTFTDTEGKDEKVTVTDWCSNDFKRDKAEEFGLDLLDLGKIHAITVERDDTNEDDTW